MAPNFRGGRRSGPRNSQPYRGSGSRGGKSTGARGGRPSHRPRFDSSRTAPEEEESEESSSDEKQKEDESEALEDDEGSDEDDGLGPSQASAEPYMSLLRSLTTQGPPKPKKRRLEGQKPEDAPRKLQRTEEPAESPDDLDHVEEIEEDPDAINPEDILDEADEDEVDASDPFETHFADPDEVALSKRLQAAKQDQWQPQRIRSENLRILLSTPQVPSDREPSGSVPAPLSGPKDVKLKARLQESAIAKRATFTDLEKTLAPYIFNYYDTLFCERSVSNGQSLRWMACLHAVNHVFKTRDRIIKNNAKLAREEGNDELDLRDQGFTRPKVLFLLPTRQSCVKMVDMICSITGVEQQENRKRFEDSYIEKEQKFGAERPPDFRDLFEGNDDDMFRLGVKFTRKTIKYFSQFYNSDILFASPLGLRTAIGSEEDKKLDFDFLSSIELVIVDQADGMLMQNWDHVDFIFEHLNLQPKDAHGCDFSRVRDWYLEGQPKYFRQTLIFTAFNTPELSHLFRSQCNNWAGKARIQREYTGVIQQLLGTRARQTFCRFDSPSVEGEPDARFEYFTKAIIPLMTKRPKESAGTLIFIPSYLDFVRIRNYFVSNAAVESLTFGSISDYTDVPEASRARSHFLNGRHRVLLYTERAHHFRRYLIKGVKRIIMYGLPDNPIFYQEIVGGYLRASEQALELEQGQGSVRVMFSKYDVLKLERTVGTSRVGKMISEKGDTFDFR